MRRGKGGQIRILVQWARAVIHSPARFLQRWWRGKIKHNAFSRLPGATNASKLVFMFYYILNFSTLKTIKEIAFSKRISLRGMYFKFTIFFSDVFVHVLWTPCFKKNIYSLYIYVQRQVYIISHFWKLTNLILLKHLHGVAVILLEELYL